MSRPRTNPDDAARANFQREVKVRRAYLDMTQRELADAVGVAPSVMSVLLNDPDKISVPSKTFMTPSNQRAASAHGMTQSWNAAACR